MKKVLQYTLAILEWLAPFASIVAIINLPAMAARVPIGSFTFWLYFVMALTGIGTLMFAIFGWIELDWLLRCYRTLMQHCVFRNQRELHFRAKVPMAFVGAFFSSLAGHYIAENSSLRIFDLIILSATIFNTACMTIILVCYIYLWVYNLLHRNVYVVYECDLLTCKGDKYTMQDTCRIKKLRDTIRRSLFASELIYCIYEDCRHSDNFPKD